MRSGRREFSVVSAEPSEGARVNRSSSNRPGAIARGFAALLCVSGVWLLLAKSGDLLGAIGSVASLGPEFLPVGLGLVAIGVINRGVQARAAHRLVGVPARIGRMVKLSASSYATNKVVRSAGAAGLVPYLANGRRQGHQRAKIVAAYMTMKFAETISLCSLIALGVFVGGASGVLHGAVLYGAIASVLYALAVSAGLVVLVTNRSAADTCAKVFRSVSSWVRTVLRRPHAEPGVALAPELADTIARIRADSTLATPLVATAFIGKVVGVASLALVLGGFGVRLGLATVVVIYTLTLMASMLGPLPAGIGAAEASLGALLVAQGVAAPSAAGVVVAFRLLDLWLPLIVGAACGLSHSRRVVGASDAVIVPVRSIAHAATV